MKISKKELKEMIREELINEDPHRGTKMTNLQRWQIYLYGEKKPFEVAATDKRIAKKLAHMMTYPAKIAIRKIVKVKMR